MMKWLISGLYLFAFTGVCEYIYLCPITEVICPPKDLPTQEKEDTLKNTPLIASDTLKVPTKEKESELPVISFTWENTQAQPNEGFERFKASVLSKKEDSTLTITGFYSPDEKGNSGKYANLGLARAAAAAKLFPEIPLTSIELRAQKQENLAKTETPFAATNFSWEVKSDPAKEAKKEEVRVVELADRQLVYFPQNSTQRLQNPVLEKYLNQLAENLKADAGSTLTLVGHTDALGDTAQNVTLGKRRAQTIKDLLVGRGIAADRIKVISKGETEPRAENNTLKGRAENRRVEIIKN